MADHPTRSLPRSAILAAILLGNLLALPAAAQVQRNFFRRGGRVAPGGAVSLPYMQPDNMGNQWMVYPGGWLQQNGPQPIFAQGETLTVNGNPPNPSNNFARLDDKTGEIVLEDMNAGTCTVTRRILFGGDNGWVRYIDIFKNTQAQEQTLSVMLSTNLNYGINGSVNVADPKHSDSQMGWVAMTGINRAALEMLAGSGSKVMPNISGEQGNNQMQAGMQLKIGAGKSVAIMHFIGTAASIDQGQQAIAAFKESKLIAALPQDIRRIIVNFPVGNGFLGDLELLRGDAFDVIELRSGDQLHGTISEPSYQLQTFYGALTLPKEQVICLLNVGQYRPRQLLVTRDGQIFGGNLQNPNISIELSSGQVVQVPLSQISRAGYRRQPNEPEEWTFDKPFVRMRSGERVNVELPADPIEVVTRYGLLKLDPHSIAGIMFQSDENGVHEVSLTDGTRFAGLVNVPEFNLKLDSAFSNQPVKFPTSAMLSLQLDNKVPDTDDTTPILALSNQDQMVGVLQGTLKLDTAFDTLQINGPEVKKISHAPGGSTDVQVTLWDDTTVSGQLEDQAVDCQLISGPRIAVPVALLTDYNQPLPRPSAAIIEKIKGLVHDLSADDWKQRDQAETALVAIGPSVVSVIKDLRSDQPPEAQARIDAVMKQLNHAGGSGGSGARPTPP